MLELTATPRIYSISPRVIGCRYAIRARVSRVARVYLVWRSVQIRATQGCTEVLTWKRKPEATSTSSTPRSAQASRSSSSACWMSVAVTGSSSVKSSASWAAVSGCGAASRAASTICRIRVWSMVSRDCGESLADGAAVRGGFGKLGFVGRLAGGGGQRLDVDRRQRRLLHHLDQLFLGPLEDGQEGDHHAEPAFLGVEQGLEQVELAVAQAREHLAHALADAQGLAPDR